MTGEDHTRWITDKLDPVTIFRDASKNWDGGYALAGILGTGDCFAMRDPNGIRPLDIILKMMKCSRLLLSGHL